MASQETRQDDAVTRKQALYSTGGMLLFLALVGLLPATGAYSAHSWKEYWAWGGGLSVAVGLLQIGISYLQPKKKA